MTRLAIDTLCILIGGVASVRGLECTVIGHVAPDAHIRDLAGQVHVAQDKRVDHIVRMADGKEWSVPGSWLIPITPGPDFDLHEVRRILEETA
jgi:hypothetical protein